MEKLSVVKNFIYCVTHECLGTRDSLNAQNRANVFGTAKQSLKNDEPRVCLAIEMALTEKSGYELDNITRKNINLRTKFRGKTQLVKVKGHLPKIFQVVFV